MTKEHKKLYKAGKNWIVATLTATTITLLGGIGAYTVHADTTIESSQDVQTTSVNQTNQVDNSNDSVTINQPVAVQSSQTAQNDQSVQGNQTNQTVPSSATDAADTSNSDSLDSNIYGTAQSSQNNNSNNSVVLNQPVTTQSNSTVKNSQPVQNTPNTLTVTAATNNSSELDPNIYGTVNVKDWDYQENNNIFNLTGYHGAYNHIILPNLNDFNNAGVNVNGATGVGITSNVLHGILCDAKNPDADLNLAISKTTGIYNDKVIAENENWAGVFCPYNLTYENGEPVLRGTKQFTLVNADLSNLDTNKVTNIAFLFNNQHKLQTVSGLNNWNTSKVTDMSYVFGACWALNNVGDLSSWDTSNVTNMAGMFGSSGLSDLTMIKDWNVSKVQNLEGTFRMMNLTALDLSRWDTSQVTNMSDMFDNLSLPIDLSKLNTSKVTDMSFMFFGAHVANIKGFENWDTSNVRTMKAMFRESNVENLLSISNWDTSKVEDMSSMFMETRNLKQLDLTKWDCSSLTNVGTPHDNMFEDPYDDMFEYSNLSFYIVLNRSKNNPNEITLCDPYGLMGNEGTIIAKIKAPTFYQQVAGKSENDIIIETITPIVEAYAKNEYTNFYMHLNPGMKEIYPTSANIKLASYVDPSNPYSAVNCQFDYTTKIGKLKDVVINYYDQDRNLIKTDYFKGVIGKSIQVPYTMPKGYILINGDQLPKSITFKKGRLQTIDVYLKKAPVTKQIIVNYVDTDGQTVKSDSLSGTVGDNISLNLKLPEGYELVAGQSIPSSITVAENEDQTITVKIKQAPVSRTLVLNYVDEDGNTIKTTTLNGMIGKNLSISVQVPNGYELSNATEVPSSILLKKDTPQALMIHIKRVPITYNTGWNQQGDDWLYMQKNGYLAKGWNYLNGHWFYFDLQSGIMKTGIQSIGNSFYYLNAQHDGTYGAMKTGWQFVNGHWIGLQGSGNAYVGWQAINGHWYYFDPQTAYALTNWQDINNHWYYFDPTNAWAQTGWFKSGAGYWYFFDYANAWADTGWQKINNSWYYFDNVNANALTGWQSINSHWYYFDPTNAWARTGWQWINGHWYWFDEANAWALTGWQYYGGQWYFMDQQNAWMDTGWTTNLANGQLYYLDKNGHPLTGWQRSLNGFWYYLQPGSDAAAIGWNWINGHWYYFNPEETINGIKAKGAMFTGRHFIDNRWNRFDLNGHWLGYEN